MSPPSSTLGHPEERRWALLWGLIVALWLYPLLRAGSALSSAEPPPLSVVYSAHAAYVWRVFLSFYGGALAFFPALLLVHRFPRAARNAVPAFTLGGALLLGLQVVLWP